MNIQSQLTHVIVSYMVHPSKASFVQKTNPIGQLDTPENPELVPI